MNRSDLFAPTSREARVAGTETTRLLNRAGLIRDFGSGLWGYTPVGERVRRKLTARVRTAFERVGGQEVSLPALAGKDLWTASGRWGSFEGEMFTLTTRDGTELCLSPSHEEAATRLLSGAVRSYADLPVTVFQIGRKYRDDHANDGLVRTKEFTMADAYSFHADRAGLTEQYDRIRASIADLLDGLGLSFTAVSAETGVMGGSTSAEFVAPVSEGGDRLRYCSADGCRFGRTDEHSGFDEIEAGDDCPRCGSRIAAKRGIEVAHVFRLGTRYADAAGLRIDTADGEECAVQMGSYGIGIDRLLQTLVRQHAASDGLVFPVTDRGCVAPFRASVIPIGRDEAVSEAVARLRASCGKDVLVYDDDRGPGERFAESDLLGIPAKVVVGNRYREEGLVDLETRAGDSRGVGLEDVSAQLQQFAGSID